MDMWLDWNVLKLLVFFISLILFGVMFWFLFQILYEAYEEWDD